MTLFARIHGRPTSVGMRAATSASLAVCLAAPAIGVDQGWTSDGTQISRGPVRAIVSAPNWLSM